MFNKPGIKVEKAVSPVQILFNAQNQMSVGIKLGKTSNAAQDIDGRKIVKAGTPLNGDLKARTTAFVKAVDTTGRVNFRAIGLTDLAVNGDEEEGEYATKTDLAKISAQLNELTQRIGNLVGELGGSAS